MELKEFTLSSHGRAIYGAYLQPDQIKRVVVLIHGLGEHAHRYLDGVVPALLEQDCAVVMFDNFGHGRSEGKRGHCPSYQALMELLNLVINKAKSLFPEIPVLLYGHSMGGNLALNYALRYTEIQGLVVTSPYLRLAFKPPVWKMKLGKILLKVYPSFTLPSGLDPRGISRIPEEVSRYQVDPLIHDLVSPMFSFPIMDAGEWAIDNASELAVPLLLMHGTADPIIDFEATRIFSKNAPKCTFVPFEGGYHELQHDLDKDKLLATVGNWIGQNFP
ncbi:MAG: lysophospholipase [Eudoraea sp.]|nr:lysophospholipase [Eudoraea sp.]